MNRPLMAIVLAAFAGVAGCHKSSGGSGGAVDTKSWVAGKIVDADGKPIVGAKVKIVGSDLGSGETDANGIFNVKLLALPASGEASVKVTAPGYTISQRRFTVSAGGTASVEVAVKAVEVKQDQAVTAVTPTITATTPDEAVQISIPNPAATLGTTGNVSVEVTAGNPKVERGIFPGDFNATDPVVPAQTTGLSSIAFVEVRVTNTDTGQSVTALAGNAMLTVKIPEGTINPDTGLPFQLGDLVPVWSFQETTGLWVRGRNAAGAEIFGTVLACVDGGLCGEFPIPHFSWWNMDYPMDRRHTLKGRVVDSGGRPVPDAAVTAYGVDQNYEFGGRTGSDGTFAFDVFRGTVCRVRARVGARETNEVSVNVPDVQSTVRSPEGPANVYSSVGSLIIADGTCVGGVVRNPAGQPIPNALVEVLGSNRFSNSDATGKYCVEGLDPSTAVTLRVTTSVLGLPVSSQLVVTTGATPGRCIDNTCLIQDIIVDSDLAGVAGIITRLSDGAPLANVNVWTDQGPFVRTGADGRYQVPARKGSPVLVSASFFDVATGQTYTTNAAALTGNTTAVLGTPATCTPLDLTLDIRNGCVQGVVYNELGFPVQGVNVYVSGFPVGSTNASGQYFINAPINPAAPVPVFFNKYVSNGRFVSHTAFVQVTQPEPACANLNVTLDFQLACVQGSVLINGLPGEGVTVSTPSGIATATDAFGNFCFDTVRGQDLTLRFFKTLLSGQTLWHEQTFTVATFPGLNNPGSCATGNCTALGTISLNRIPVITLVTGVPLTILSRGASTVTVTASDPDADTLTYFWNAPGGTFASPTSAATTWTAPLVLASTVFPLSVQVSDGRGGLVGTTLNVTVNPAPNLAPAIASVTPVSSSVLTSGSTGVNAVATDPDGDAVTFSWSATGGLVVGGGASVNWVAPSTPGTFTITATASDGNASSSLSTTVAVTAPANRAPVIASLTASPNTVGRNGTSTASVSASDPDGNPLTFIWSTIGGGTFAGSGNTVTVTAPAVPGAFQVQVQVSDGLLSTTSNTTITVVNTAPVVSLLTATPALVVGGQTSILSSVAGDPEGDVLTYSWSQTAPPAGALPGTGPSLSYVAPGAPGVYTIQLQVSDGLLSAVQTVNVTVGNRPPQIGSISATPGSVGRGDSTTLAVTATDPDLGETLTLAYGWIQASGPATSTINTPTAATSTVTMPVTEGTYVFQVTVTDTGSPPLNVQATVNVVVGNRAPIITAMTATPASVALSGTSTIAVTASDPDGEAITYAYSATGGSIPGTTASEVWTAPGSAATHTITVTVSDGALSVQQTVNVVVAPDVTPPTVVNIAPLNNAVNVPLASTIVATFSEPINPATVTATSFTVSGGVTGSISFSGGNTVATLTPSVALTATTVYTVTLTPAVQDVNGNPLAANNSTFTTLTVVPTISIDDVTTLEGNAGSTNAVFTLTLSQATGATVTVTAQTAGGTATSGTDFTATGPTVITFTPGQTTRTFTVPVLGDISDEVNEGYVVNLSVLTGATFGDNQGAGSITDDDGSPSLSIGDVSVAEGNAGTVNLVFTVTLAPASGLTVTVRADTADGTAAAGTDYAAIVNQTLTFNPGETTKTVTVVVNGETVTEANETLLVNLSNETNAALGDGSGQGTITNDDALPSITIGDVTTPETGTAAFTLTLSNASQSTVTVQVDTANSTATAPADYAAVVAQTVTFNPGETSKPLNVTIAADALNEVDEAFFVNLSVPVNATIADLQAVGTITNDDPVPTLSIDDVAATEGGTLTFTVTLSAASGRTVTVTAATADGTALAPADYAAVGSTVLSFAPGETTKSVVVNSAADVLNEADETFVVNLTLPVNATITDNQGTGTINNDDPLPSLSINDVAVPEGNTGTSLLTFTASLSTASGRTVTVTAQTADNTATTADVDYLAAGPTVLTFAPGETAKTFQVTVNGDLAAEATESFFGVLSGETNATLADGTGVGTITNDDVPPIAITSLSLYSGPVGAVVRVNGTNFDPVPANNTVRFNGTAATVASGTTTSLLVSVPGGATTGAVTVQVGATPSNPSDTFTVLVAPGTINTTLSVSKALSAKRHAFVPVPDAVTFLKSAAWATAYTNGPSVDRYLVGTGDSIKVFNVSDDSLVIQLAHSATNDELIIDLAVTKDGQKSYAAVAGPLDAGGEFQGFELQVVNNLGGTPALGSRVNLRSQVGTIRNAEQLFVTPDGTKALVLTDYDAATSLSASLVVVSTATDTVTNTIVLPDLNVGTFTSRARMAIHPSGSHAYIVCEDTDDVTKNYLGTRLLTFDLGTLTFLGGATLTGLSNQSWKDIVVRPGGTSAFVMQSIVLTGVNSFRVVDLTAPAAPVMGGLTPVFTSLHPNFELNIALSPDDAMLYLRGVMAGEEFASGTEVGNILLLGFDVRSGLPTPFDEVYLGATDMYVHFPPRWHFQGTRLLASTPGVLNPAGEVKQDGIVHSMRVFPAGAQADLPPFKGGPSGAALAGSTMTVFVFDDVTEMPLAGVNVSLSNNSGGVTTSATTDANGNAAFPGLTGPQNVTIAPAGRANITVFGVNAQNLKFPAVSVDDNDPQKPKITVVINGIPGGEYIQGIESSIGGDNGGDGQFPTSTDNIRTASLSTNEKFSIGLHSGGAVGPPPYRTRRHFARALPGARLFWNATVVAEPNTHTIAGDLVFPPTDIPNGFDSSPGFYGGSTRSIFADEQGNGGSGIQNGGGARAPGASIPYGPSGYTVPAGVSNVRFSLNIYDGAGPFGAGLDPRVAAQGAEYGAILNLGATPAATLTSQNLLLMDAPFLTTVAGTAIGSGSGGFFTTDSTPTVVFRDVLGPGGYTGRYELDLRQQRPGGNLKVWHFILSSTDAARISGGLVTFTMPDLPAAAVAESFASANNRPIEVEAVAEDYGGGFNFNAWELGNIEGDGQLELRYSRAGIGYIQGAVIGAPGPSAALADARYNHGVAVLVDNNRILVAGGNPGPGPSLASAEIYNAATNTVDFTRNTSTTAVTAMNKGRNEVVPVRLLDGRVLFASGNDNGTGVRHLDGDVFNDASGLWALTTVPNMVAGRIGHAGVLLNDGRVLIVGGITGTNPNETVVPELEIYDPATNNWAPHNTGGGANTLVARDGPKLTIINPGASPTQVLVTGGMRPPTGLLLSNAVVEPTACIITVPDGLAPTIGPAISMSTPRTGHAVVRLVNGDLLLLGGANAGSEFVGFTMTATVDRFIFASQTFALESGQLLEAKGGMPAVLVNSGGTPKVLLVGGRTGDGPSGIYELYNPATGATDVVRVGVNRDDPRAVVIPRPGNPTFDRVILIGGRQDDSSPVNTIETYDP